MDLDHAAQRVVRLTLLLTASGAAVCFTIWGWRDGCGFLLGGLIAGLSFYWLKRTVLSLGETPARKPLRARVAVFLGLRYVLLGVAAYVILMFSEFSATAFLAGLFVPTVAVILEILIELIHDRT